MKTGRTLNHKSSNPLVLLSNMFTSGIGSKASINTGPSKNSLKPIITSGIGSKASVNTGPSNLCINPTSGIGSKASINTGPSVPSQPRWRYREQSILPIPAPASHYHPLAVSRAKHPTNTGPSLSITIKISIYAHRS